MSAFFCQFLIHFLISKIVLEAKHAMYEFPDIITNLSSMFEKSFHSFSILELCKQSSMNKLLL